MANMPRFVKTFSVVGKRFYRKGQAPRTERPDPGIDDRVNEWVKETGNIIVGATAARHTVMEKSPDGTIIRKTVQMMTIIYQDEQNFLESEAEMRRRALIPTPKRPDDEDKPTPMSDEEERREATDSILGPPTAKVDSDAGGPEGIDQFLPADDDEDEDL